MPASLFNTEILNLLTEREAQLEAGGGLDAADPTDLISKLESRKFHSQETTKEKNCSADVDNSQLKENDKNAA
jgi:hypothetical protein